MKKLKLKFEKWYDAGEDRAWHCLIAATGVIVASSAIIAMVLCNNLAQYLAVAAVAWSAYIYGSADATHKGIIRVRKAYDGFHEILNELSDNLKEDTQSRT